MISKYMKYVLFLYDNKVSYSDIKKYIPVYSPV